MTNTTVAISNHGSMMGGGEYSFLDLVSHLPATWRPIAVAPEEGELATRLRRNGIETETIPLPAIRPWFILNIIDSVRAYINVCRKHCASLIYANGSRAAFYGGLVGRILRLPVIWHCRIAERDLYLDSLLARLTTGIVANSKATARRFESHFQSKVRVVYNGVDIEWLRDRAVQKPALAQDEWKIILVAARISKWKRHDVALSAFEQVAKSHPKAHLVCIGAEDTSDRGWWAHLQERTRCSPFSAGIHWMGQVDDVRPWYQSAYMLVLGSENEPFGRVLVEAMACGVPVIASRGGGVPEIVRHGQDGLLVTPGNVDELAEAMERLLEDKTLRKRFVRSSQQRAELFSLDAHVANMLDVFKNAIKN